MAADVTVLPSYYESFGMVALEAMACGSPVVGSRVGGLTTTVRDGVTGYLVPEGDATALAQRLADLLTDPDARERLGREGARWAAQHRWPCVAGVICREFATLEPSPRRTWPPPAAGSRLGGRFAPRATLPRTMTALLQVRHLHTQFLTRGGVVRAVDGVSWDVGEGETVALVGESGCGKSVSALSIMRLVSEPAGRIIGGQILFKGRDLLTLSEEEMRKVRGREIAMIFQEPMTSLNPVLTIGRQLTQGLEIHLGMTPGQARERAVELLALVGIPDRGRRLGQYPHQFSGGMRQRMNRHGPRASPRSPRQMSRPRPSTSPSRRDPQ